jgi:predicted phosphodiesterase
MNTIIAISDTHLEWEHDSSRKHLPQDILVLIKNAQLVLHAGDLGDQMAYDLLLRDCSEYSEDPEHPCELWAIQGLYSPIIYERFGIKIGLIHDYNGEANESYDFSESEALEIASGMQETENRFIGVDLMVFGHIHEPIVSWNKDNSGKRRLLVCPGPGARKGLYHKCPPTPTAAKINVDNGKISSVQIISINE